MKHPLLLLIFLLTSSFAFTQLNGGYTIDTSLAVSATNYLSFSSAVSDLANGTRTDGGTVNGPGVNGAVTFTVAAGTWNESISIPSITGSSATNSITFDGVDPATRKITSAGSSAYDATIEMTNGDWIKIRNLTIENTGASYGYGVKLINDSYQCEVTGCNIKVPLASTSNYHVGLIAGQYYTQYANNAEDLIVEDNVIEGGRYNMILNGSSGYFTPGIEVRNNVLKDAYLCGIRTYYLQQFLVEENDISTSPTYNFNYGMQIYYTYDFEITANEIYSNGSYGVYFYYANTLGSNRAKFTNNFVGGEYRSTGTCYGVYGYYFRDIDFFHNSIHVDNVQGTTGRGAFITTGSQGNDIRNNSFAYSGGQSNGHAFYCSNSNYIQTLDYNNYYSNAPNLVYMSGNYSTLGALQTAYPLWNINSRDFWPNYQTSTNLHTFGAALANWADNNTAVVVDIDGDTRPMGTDTVKDVGADEFVLAPQDLDIMQIVSPTVLTLGNNQVIVQVQNQGSLSLNNVPVTLQYSTDGGTTWPVSQVFNHSGMLNATGDVALDTFNVDWNVLAAGTFTLCVRANPQVTGDPDASDEICQLVCTGMGGAYTINPAAPISQTNFQNFTDAVTALNVCGIGSAVTFTVSPGSYNENLTLGQILGTSATNTITFDGVSSAQCTLWQSFTSTNQALLKFDGTDYTTFTNMVLDVSQGSYGYGVHFTNQADHNEISNCKIYVNTTTLSSYNIGILMSGSSYTTYANSANYTKIDNNEIWGGYYGMRVNGASTSSFITHNEITNNVIRDFYYSGIWSRYISHIEFSGNEISARLPGSSSGYGMYMYYVDSSFSVQNNRIYQTGNYGIYLAYANQTGTSTNNPVVNNMCGDAFQTSSSAYGMYLFNVKNADIIYNSGHNGWQNGYACYLAGSVGSSTGIRFLNNTWANYSGSTSNGGAIYIANMQMVSLSDYNNFFSTGGNFINVNGNNFNTMSWYNTAYSAHDQNSINVDPRHVSSTDLHVVCSQLDNVGTPVPGITLDIDGDTRSATTPDIGADEFSSLSFSIDLGPDTTHCGAMYIDVDTAFTSYLWSNGALDYYSILDSTDTYYLEVTDTNNCWAVDTINAIINVAPTDAFLDDSTFVCLLSPLDPGNDSTGSTFMWDNGDTNRLRPASTQGWNWIEVTSTDGCVLRDSVYIDFYQTPFVTLGNDTTFCLGGGTQLDAGLSHPFQTYQWSTGASTQVIIVSAPGTYTVTVTTPDGCQDYDTIAVNALLPPVVNLGPDRTECESVTLDAGNPGATYNWQPGGNGQLQNITQSGNYAVTVTNAAGCSATDNVNVVIEGNPVPNLGSDQTICLGSSTVLDPGLAGMNYLWSTGATTQTISVSAGGSYVVEVSDPTTGCAGYDTVSVIVAPGNLNLGPDVSLCSGQSLTLDAGAGASSYSWSTGDNSRSINVTTAGTYTVTVVDGNCTAMDTVVVSATPGVTAAFSAPVAAPMNTSIAFSDQSSGNPSGFSWDFGDGNFSTIQNPNHIYVAMGTFTVTMIVNNGTCFDTTTSDITITAPVGIDDELLNDGVTLYPNPNTGRFYLAFDFPEAIDIDVEVINLAGQIIYRDHLPNVISREEQINLQDRAAGLYLVKVRSGDRQIVQRMMID